MIRQQIVSTYASAGAKAYIADLKRIQAEQAKVFGAGGDGAPFGGGGRGGGPERQTKAQAAAMKNLRETLALARIEFDKLNLANRRGEISNKVFQESVTKLRARVTPDLVAIRNSFESVPRAIEIQYGRAMVTLDHFATRSQEVLTGQTRLRTRIGQAIGDQARLFAGRLPGGHAVMAAGSSLGIGGKALLGAGVGLAAAAGIAKATAMAIKYEDALREVRKTTGATAEETEALGDSLLDLSVKLGMSEIELANIAAVAGQLGIKGQKDITTFTETTAKLAAVSDLTAEEAASALGKIANAFELPISESERLGSVINQLSNDTAASSAEIVDALQRVGPAGLSIGLAVDQVAGLAATLIETGIESRRAGTQIRNILTLIQTKAADVAKTLGVTKAEFTSMISEDALGAMQKYFAAIQKLPPTLRTIEISKVFGHENLLAVTAFAAATEEGADGVSRLEGNVRDANTAFEEATSLQKEYAIALDTTSGQFGLLWQRIKAGTVAIGGPFNTALRETLRLLNAVLYTAAGVKSDNLERLANLFGGASTGKTSPDSPDTGFSGADIRKFQAFAGAQVQSIRDRIEALEEEKAALLELEEGTERLAEVNRELKDLKEQQNKLSKFGLADPKGADVLDRAADTLQKIAEAQEVAARSSDEEKRHLTEIFRLQGVIAEIEELQKTLGSEAGAEQLEFARKRLEVERQSLANAEELRAKFKAAADAFAGLIGKAGMGAVESAGFKSPEMDESFASLIKGGLISSKALRDVGLTADEVERLVKALEDTGKPGVELREILEGIAGAIRATTRLVDVFGDLDENVRRVADGVADVLDGFSNLSSVRSGLSAAGTSLSSAAGIAAQIPGYIGIAAGIASAVAGLVGAIQGSTETQAEHLEALRESRDEQVRLRIALADSVKAFKEAVSQTFGGGIIGGAFSGKDIAAMQDAIGRLQQIERGQALPGTDLVATVMPIFRMLQETGIPAFEDIESRFQEMIASGFSTRQAISALLGGEQGIVQVMERLVEHFGKFADNVDGLVAELGFRRDMLGESAGQLLDILIERIQSAGIDLGGGVEAFLLDALSGIDLSTEEGLKQLRTMIAQLMQLFMGEGTGTTGIPNPFLGATDLDLFESLSPEQFQEFLDLLGQLAEQAETDLGGAGGAQASRSVQYLRMITEAQGNELVLLLREISYYIKQMATGLSGPVIPPSVSAMVSSVTARPTYATPNLSQSSSNTNSLHVGDVTFNGGKMSDRDLHGLMVQLEEEIRRRNNRGFGR